MQTVCFITPPSPFLLDERVFPALGILKVAAVVRQAGYPVEHLDLNGVPEFRDVVAIHCSETDANVFCLTATTPQMPAAMKVADLIRTFRRDAILVLGGPHATLVSAARKQGAERASDAWVQIAASFDTVIAGDGETGILEAIEDGWPAFVDADDPRTDLFMTPEVLESAPWPARDLVDLESYQYEIDGSRVTPLISQLGCPFGCHFSVTGDTLIFHDRGWQPVSELIVGAGAVRRCVHGGQVRDYAIDTIVATHRGRSVASGAIEEGIRPVFRLTAGNGLWIDGTQEHPLLGLNASLEPVWRQIGEYAPGDWVILQTPARDWPETYAPLRIPEDKGTPPGGFEARNVRTPRRFDEDLAWLTGYIIGGGCLPSDGRPGIHVAIKDRSRDQLLRLFPKLFGVPLLVYKSTRTDKMQHGWLYSRVVRTFFEEIIGIDPTDKLRVPEIVFRSSPRSVVEAFLDGLWCADAYMRQDYLTTVSEQLAMDVCHLLLLLGRLPFVNQQQYADNKPHYRITGGKRDSIPSMRGLYRSQKSGRWFWRTLKSVNRNGVRRDTLRRSGLSHPLDIEGRFYVRVRSVEPLGEMPVYDLNVEEDHSFIANGFVAHNCAGRSSPMLRRARIRSADSVIAEMRHLIDLGFTGFMFFDDELNVNRGLTELLQKICDLQEEVGVDFRCRGFVKAELFTDDQARLMYRAGFRKIMCGFESGSPRILKNINKNATISDNTRAMEISHKHGLGMKALMSLGHPGEDNNTAMDTLEWLLDVAPQDFDCTIITSYPGSPYYDRAVRDFETRDWCFEVNGDRLYMEDIDYSTVEDFYKGSIDGYRSYVYTDKLDQDELVFFRNYIERTARERLGIPFYQARNGPTFEASMGQLPGAVYRRSE